MAQLPAIERMTGQFDGTAFLFPIRIYFADTDAGGVVFHGRYLEFAERARTEMLRSLGLDMGTVIEETGAMFVVRNAELDYRQAARLDEVLRVRVQVLEHRGSSMLVDHVFIRDDTVLAQVRVTLVCVNRNWRPTRIPDTVRERLAVMPS